MWPGIYRDEIRLFENPTSHEKRLFYDDGWLSLMIGNDEYYRKAFSKRMLLYFRAWVVAHEKVKSSMDYLHHIILLQNFLINSIDLIPFLTSTPEETSTAFDLVLFIATSILL